MHHNHYFLNQAIKVLEMLILNGEQQLQLLESNQLGFLFFWFYFCFYFCFYFFLTKTKIRFALVLKGAIRVSQAGWYTISTLSDDGIRLYIGGVLVIESWMSQTITSRSIDIYLDSSIFYSIQLEYYHENSEATLKLRYFFASIFDLFDFIRL